MTYPFMLRELEINLANGEFQINIIDQPEIIGPVDHGWWRFRKAAAEQMRPDPIVMTWGGGPLAGSRIPGTRRLVFCSYSPLWQGFYISSLGGGAYILHRIGVDFVTILGSAPQDSVLILNHNHGQVELRLEPVNPDLLWTGYGDSNGNGLIGFYALQQAMLDRYKHEYDNDWVRVFATGPAARHTNQGIIGSNQVKNGEISPIDDWAGRGGFGSRLLQAHRIAACIFGGDWEDPDLKDSKEIDGYFQTYYGNSMIKVDLGAGEKYRYVPGFQTGGTFGVNMHTVGDKLFSFNYESVYEPAEARLEQHANFIRDHYLKQFNEETIQPKNFTHCGEPCAVACKKYDRVYKKDYEPYQALGPLCGVFDQRAAEVLNHYVDAMGIDAIQIGGTIAWIMELVRDGLVDPARFNLPGREQMQFKFAKDNSDFDVVASSAQNADYAKTVVDFLVFETGNRPFARGIRSAANWLDRELGLTEPGKRTIDRAVFTAHGEYGCMTPNQYWVPGMLSPMPIMGKYFVYYGLEFVPPAELGRRCVERMVYELFSENSGVCRFHRKWAEAIIDEIITTHYALEVDYKSHQFALAKAIYELEGAQVVFWESERTIDVIWKYLEDWLAEGLEDDRLKNWVERFRQDKWSAARAYWDELRRGIAEGFAAGAQAIPEISPPYRAAKMDVMEKNRQ